MDERVGTRMPGKAPMRLAGVLIVACIVFAMPLAGAFSAMGVDARSAKEMRDAGAAPQLGQTWVGRWMKTSGWSGFESDLRTMRDSGVTPVIMWYYWGDDISVSCVRDGCNGRNRGEWDSLMREMAKRAHATMGSKPFYVVLEPEFNKNGVQHWETFDGYLETQAKTVRSIAPSARLVVGFGHWGGWTIFDRAVAASDLSGVQLMRASTRDSESVALNSASYTIDNAKKLKSLFGKNVLLYDLAIGSYGGWEGVQEKVLQSFIDRRAELGQAGVVGVVWRYVHDNNNSSGYFGAAESSWGVKKADGTKKRAYDELVTLLKGTTSTSTPPATHSSDVFSGVTGNNWWIQAKVAKSPTKVETRVNGGPWVNMPWHSWGAWAVSTHAPTGSVVELRATYGDGSTARTSHTWSSTGPTSQSSFSATFSGVKVQEWWVQTSVQSTEPVAKVEARVNGGSWIGLDAKSYGWAKSIKVPSGAKVEFRATSTSGATATSSAYSR